MQAKWCPSPLTYIPLPRKAKLIEAIHGLQPARLTTSFFKQEGENIMAQLVTLQLYLDASPGGSDEDPDMAAYVNPHPLLVPAIHSFAPRQADSNIFDK